MCMLICITHLGYVYGIIFQFHVGRFIRLLDVLLATLSIVEPDSSEFLPYIDSPSTMSYLFNIFRTLGTSRA